MRSSGTSRRIFMGTTAAGATGFAAGLVLPGLRPARAATEVVLGIVYVGSRADFGWNQAHAVAMEALRKLPDVRIVEEENVPETLAVAKSMESMINLDGANIMLATSFGYYNPFVVDTAKK